MVQLVPGVRGLWRKLSRHCRLKTPWRALEGQRDRGAQQVQAHPSFLGSQSLHCPGDKEELLFTEVKIKQEELHM